MRIIRVLPSSATPPRRPARPAIAAAVARALRDLPRDLPLRPLPPRGRAAGMAVVPRGRRP